MAYTFLCRPVCGWPIPKSVPDRRPSHTECGQRRSIILGDRISWWTLSGSRGRVPAIL